MRVKLGAAGLIAAAGQFGGTPASAQTTPAETAPGTAAPAGTAPAGNAADQPAAPATPSPIPYPSMSGPLAFSSTPTKFDAGPLGPVYVTGVGSGLALTQTNPTITDRFNQFDITNGQVMVQKSDGIVQFYAQAGAYSLPSLGTPYVRAGSATGDFFGPLPEGFIKIAPDDSFSILAGKLPTLIGYEYSFTFENMNVERGLLWNQENVINRGVQGNYTWGPLALSLSLNDGFYSGHYNWLTGSATYTIDSSNSLSVTAGGNLGTTNVSTLVTPLAQDNSDIYDLIYTYNAAPWTITPYFQYTDVGKNHRLGFGHDAQTYGGAILANYAFTPNFSLAGRGEIIGSSGSLADGAPNLLYGPGSSAFSLTVTPTYQEGIFFARAEGSFVDAWGTSSGFAFGRSGNASTQFRFLVEAGVIF
ncbi:MAG: porin [Alphaproteobacteria bacterium]|nr:porin [Alphaproteobacteria bacterium]